MSDVYCKKTGKTVHTREHKPPDKWQEMKLDLDFALTGEDGPEALLEAIDTPLNRKPLLRIN